MHSQHYVGFWRRALAMFFDGTLWTLFIGVLAFALYGADYAASWEYVEAEDGPGLMPEFLLHWLLPALVTVLFWEYKLATPGKMVIAVRIVDADTFERPRPVQWIVRYLGYFASGLPLGLGFLWVAVDPRKQGWHDKLANTVVIFSREAPAPLRREESSPDGESQARVMEDSGAAIERN